MSQLLLLLYTHILLTEVGTGGFVWNKSIQNAKDTLQKSQSSGGGKLDKEGNATKVMDNTSKKASGLNGNVKNVNPSEIRFSQTSVNGSEEIIASMKSNGWKGDPIDVVKMPDGNLTTIDNTRVAAAREVGIEVQATIRNYSDPLPADMVARFTTPKGVPKTWGGEALDLRIQKQKASFRNNNPMGSYDLEKMK
ncbi:ParB/RepB/Spo0J family partition protein [Bacillus pseudomycoides]|uniref:ParB/RepB/Spo0J family partition protein n=1 Tax=Bacillus pseudomycoides TaxID=64104 RepID=UPI00211D2D06